MRKRLPEQFGIKIGICLSGWNGKVWRGGLMGINSQLKMHMVKLFLTPLKVCLLAQGVKFTPGAGVAAAEKAYAAAQS